MNCIDIKFAFAWLWVVLLLAGCSRRLTAQRLEGAAPAASAAPVDPDGLPSDSMTLLKSTKAAGVNINIVNEVGTVNDLDRFSRVNTSNYQFYNIMKAANTATTPVNGTFPAGT